MHALFCEKFNGRHQMNGRIIYNLSLRITYNLSPRFYFVLMKCYLPEHLNTDRFLINLVKKQTWQNGEKYKYVYIL